MIIDLHIHTHPLSPDSSQSPEEAVRYAKQIGLECICFTEHNRAWDENQILELSNQLEFPVLHGVEVDTVEGHVLVFGLHRDFEGIIRVEELHKLVREVNGVMIAAHPFKGFRAFGLSDLNLSIEQASEKPVFRHVELLEGFNGRSLERENRLVQDVAGLLGLKTVGGSDAHATQEIGRCVTIFDNEISKEAELLIELKEGRFRPGILADGAFVDR
ncbi:MAG: PHP domain-containing protein [Chloroflexota bacterium]|nr:PHP domain-containing protein [Chloroflexota bacterium]